MTKQAIRGHFLALFTVIVWATTFLVSKTLVRLVTPAQLMFLRFAVAYAVLWLLHPHWKLCGKDEALFVLMALFANTLYFIAENTALAHTYASNVSILVSAAPILTAVLLAAFYKDERLSSRKALGFVVAFAGVVLVVFNGALVLHISPLGDLLALAAAASWAVYSLVLKRCSGTYNSFLLSRKLMFYGMLTSLPILLVEGAPLPTRQLMQFGPISGLLYLGVVASALCYVAWDASVKCLGVMKTNLYIYAIPLVTVAGSALFLNEPVTPMGAAGMLLVVGGMVMSSVSSKKGRGAGS